MRFGKDPQSSVLDPWCKAHELDNLYVTDTLVLRHLRLGEPDADHGGECAARGRSFDRSAGGEDSGVVLLPFACEGRWREASAAKAVRDTPGGEMSTVSGPVLHRRSPHRRASIADAPSQATLPLACEGKSYAAMPPA
ncbi:MAG: GMC oxidoreductase [Caulobacteraceae bacterium]